MCMPKSPETYGYCNVFVISKMVEVPQFQGTNTIV